MRVPDRDSGGDLVNIVPDDVRIETLVRAKEPEALGRWTRWWTAFRPGRAIGT